MENQHNQAIPADVLADVQKKINEAAALLKPYVINLTVAQRRDISKMGDKSLAFVSKALELAAQNPTLCNSRKQTNGRCAQRQKRHISAGGLQRRAELVQKESHARRRRDRYLGCAVCCNIRIRKSGAACSEPLYTG